MNKNIKALIELYLNENYQEDINLNFINTYFRNILYNFNNKQFSNIIVCSNITLNNISLLTFLNNDNTLKIVQYLAPYLIEIHMYNYFKSFFKSYKVIHKFNNEKNNIHDIILKHKTGDDIKIEIKSFLYNKTITLSNKQIRDENKTAAIYFLCEYEIKDKTKIYIKSINILLGQNLINTLENIKNNIDKRKNNQTLKFKQMLSNLDFKERIIIYPKTAENINNDIKNKQKIIKIRNTFNEQLKNNFIEWLKEQNNFITNKKQINRWINDNINRFYNKYYSKNTKEDRQLIISRYKNDIIKLCKQQIDKNRLNQK